MNRVIKTYKEVPKVWGKEIWITNNNLYCGKFLYLNKGGQSSLHFHQLKDETFYILKGRIKFEYITRSVFSTSTLQRIIEGDKEIKINSTFLKEEYILYPGDSIRLQPCDTHRFTGLEKSIIIEFSTLHSDDDVVRLEPSAILGKKEVQEYLKKLRDRAKA